MMQKKILILPNIRSALNVGSIFRTADAIGVSTIYCTGITPTPIDRFGFVDKQIAKTALGAEKSILWEKHNDVFVLVETLKSAGIIIVGLEQGEKAVDYKSISITSDVAVILGEEVGGIPVTLQEYCDLLVEIPMHGMKESLNVSVAAGVLLFRMFDR